MDAVSANVLVMSVKAGKSVFTWILPELMKQMGIPLATQKPRSCANQGSWVESCL